MNRRTDNAEPFAARAHKPNHHAGVNPYRDAHFSFGQELVSAEDAPLHKGQWSTLFGREAPLCLELGVGNGNWLVEQSAAAPGANWLGLEIRYKRCVLAAEKLRKRGCAHAKIVRYSWFDLDDLFDNDSLDAIYLHHPDPWSKGTEAKHRLIQPRFVEQVARLLRKGGEFRLKTDFRPHFEAMVRCAESTALHPVAESLDVRTHGAPWPDDIVTGYQAKFDRDGVPVFALRMRRAG